MGPEPPIARPPQRDCYFFLLCFTKRQRAVYPQIGRLFMDRHETSLVSTFTRTLEIHVPILTVDQNHRPELTLPHCQYHLYYCNLIQQPSRASSIGRA